MNIKLMISGLALIGATAVTAQDNQISQEESEEIRIVWDKLKSYCEGFVRCCEEGDFATIQKELDARK